MGFFVEGNCPEMDFVLFCVSITVELNKDKWKLLCGMESRVQEHLVLEKLHSIQDAAFKEQVVQLFKLSLEAVYGKSK